MSHHRPFGEFTPIDQPSTPVPRDQTAANTQANAGQPLNTAKPNMSRQSSGTGTFTPAFPSDAGLMMSSSQIHHPIPSRQPSAFNPSRRGSFANPQPDLQGLQSLSRRGSMNTRPDLMSLSRRNSLAGGPRPITKAEYSGPNTPSLLSRAGSPVMPLGNDQTLSREHSREGGFSLQRRELRQGEFIGSLDCGTT
jgi:glycerol kinase